MGGNDYDGGVLGDDGLIIALRGAGDELDTVLDWVP